MRTPICDEFGIEYPILAFTPSEHVAAAVSRAGRRLRRRVASLDLHAIIIKSSVHRGARRGTVSSSTTPRTCKACAEVTDRPTLSGSQH